MSAVDKIKTGWDKASVIVQGIGSLAIVVSIVTLIFNVNQFNTQQKTTSQTTAEQFQQAQNLARDQQYQATLNTYLDRISDLLLMHHLAHNPDAAVRAIAIARTDTALRNLDGNRKGTLVRFLWDAGLLHGSHPIIPLNGFNLQQAYFAYANLRGANLSGAHLYQANFSLANLSGVNLSGADLDNADLLFCNLSGTNLSGASLYRAYVSSSIPNFNLNAAVKDARYKEAYLYPTGLVGANLSGAYLPIVNLSGSDLPGIDLRGANLYEADLVNANFRDANLSSANLSGADLNNTDLYGADLRGAQVSTEQLAQARSLKGAIMPDGSIHP